MTYTLDVLLKQVVDPTMRAAISAGWELGKGLDPGRDIAKQMRREIEKGAEIVSSKEDLDVDAVYGAALLSMAMTRNSKQNPLT